MCHTRVTIALHNFLSINAFFLYYLNMPAKVMNASQTRTSKSVMHANRQTGCVYFQHVVSAKITYGCCRGMYVGTMYLYFKNGYRNLIQVHYVHIVVEWVKYAHATMKCTQKREMTQINIGNYITNSQTIRDGVQRVTATITNTRLCIQAF